jgi:hypothetical protein
MTTISFTSSELELLNDKLIYKTDKYTAADIIKAILEITTNIKNLYSSEQCFFSENISNKEYPTIETQELTGEGEVFVLFDDRGSLTFKFCTRHLKKFLLRKTLREMPLFINSLFISLLASWRLQIAK